MLNFPILTLHAAIETRLVRRTDRMMRVSDFGFWILREVGVLDAMSSTWGDPKIGMAPLPVTMPTFAREDFRLAGQRSEGALNSDKFFDDYP
ncbi:hypothetical protein H6S82_03980 [Planktothrix sp. FACHB-1355]|uniref:Uncharacterized protein n=1 Tax=Aerosakkonema funiforme FACHB-1375 TaxID=2949571 RepID=A0A926VB21_9CYAN|nr:MULTISPECIES: hypothetical protein [Oscillatoriales]MBD2180093.1 hypothetical protein [Aerosakkonema funiforme FACHB-1375]MBD3558016.1 hypothetical protein [Planktothrix sp. FACHB-1355]